MVLSRDVYYAWLNLLSSKFSGQKLKHQLQTQQAYYEIKTPASDPVGLLGN
jgi:hypothetical protein